MGDMNEIFETSRKTLQDVEQRLEMPRREFLQFCATLAVDHGSAGRRRGGGGQGDRGGQAAFGDLAAFSGVHRLLASRCCVPSIRPWKS